MSLRAWAFGVGLFALAQPAHADVQARARLTYDVSRGPRSCPTDTDLRAAVGARLGYDPFVDPASLSEVSVRVESRGRSAVGLLEIRGPHPGTREIASPTGDCREVVDSLATAIAISLDPASLTRPPETPPPPPPPPPPVPAAAEPLPPLPPPPPPPPPPTPPTPTPPPPTPHPPALPPASNERVHPALGASAALLLGELPRIAPGIDVWVGARYRFVDVSLEGSFATAAEHRGAGTAHATLLTGALAPCAVYKYWSGCVVGRLGALRGEGAGVALPERASAVYGSLGARAGVELPVYALLVLRGYAELDVPVTRIGLELDGTEVWATPTLAARFALGAGLRF